MKKLLREFIYIGLALFPLFSDASIVGASAECDVSTLLSSGLTLTGNCAGISDTPGGAGINRREEISFPPLFSLQTGRFANSGYSVLANYGHLGAEAHAFTLGFNEDSGSYVAASSRVSAFFEDYISVTSDTLPYASEVPVNIGFNITGNVNSANGTPYPGYSVVGMSGYLFLDRVNNFAVPIFYSPFCVSGSAITGCTHNIDNSSSSWSFEIEDSKVIYLNVGYTYRINASLQIGAFSSVDPTRCFDSLGCRYNAALDSSHSLFANLSPASSGFQLISESRHDYSISAIPEPSSEMLSLSGIFAIFVFKKLRSRAARKWRLLFPQNNLA